MARSSSSSARPPRPLLGLVAGLAAGIVASAVMELFQNTAARSFDVAGDAAESATAKTASAVVDVVTDEGLPRDERPAAGRIVHYAMGAALGGAYGIAAEYRPQVAAGFGSAYGVATSLLLDEAAVPALGLGRGPTETPPGTHLYGLASHLVFGFALEGARMLFGGREGQPLTAARK